MGRLERKYARRKIRDIRIMQEVDAEQDNLEKMVDEYEYSISMNGEYDLPDSKTICDRFNFRQGAYKYHKAIRRRQK